MCKSDVHSIQDTYKNIEVVLLWTLASQASAQQQKMAQGIQNQQQPPELVIQEN
jgi:hypothetical protein